MSFDRLSRRQFGGIASWVALAQSTESAQVGDANPSQESRPPDWHSSFPSDFLWGTATSAYQIEGAVKEDGRGPSIWDRYAHTHGTISDHSNADTATDHYHLYREDVQLMKALGAKAYRFSIAWPRVFPEGAGTPNPKGLDFYNRLLDGGFSFTGHNPTISIAVSLNRNSRFRKVAPGTFDLVIRDAAKAS